MSIFPANVQEAFSYQSGRGSLIHLEGGMHRHYQEGAIWGKGDAEDVVTVRRGNLDAADLPAAGGVP
jgi:hypothetical protein